MQEKNLKCREDWTSQENDIFKAVITPELASLMLSASTECDRKETVSNTQKITKSMKNGQWYSDVCGNQIGFDKEGKLIDGKHTLKSVLLSGKPQILKVEVGCVHPELVDCGKGRTMKERLGYYGFNKTDVDNLSSAVRNILNLRDGNKWPINTGLKATDYDEQAYIDFMTENMDKLEHVLDLYNNLKKELIAPLRYKNRFEKSIIMSYLYYLIYDKGFGEERVYKFFSGICSASSSKNQHIEKARLVFYRNSQASKAAFYKPIVVHNLIVRYFNDYISNSQKVTDYSRKLRDDEVLKFSTCLFHS